MDTSLEYNTQKATLVIPEYGRNVQNMIAHCKTIESREERNNCAQAIIKVCLLYTSPSPRDGATSRMPSSA